MTAHPEYLWRNGELVKWEDATIHLTDLAWGAVGAVFEGIRAYTTADGQGLNVFRLPEHMQRLRDSSRLVRLPLSYSVDDLIGFTIELLRANNVHEDTYIFPLVHIGGDHAQRNDPRSLVAAMYMRHNPSVTHLCTGLAHHARVSSWTRISDNVMPPRIKNISNYRNGQLANYEAKLDGYDSAILLGPQGKVSEAPGACLMMVRHGKLITPDTTSGILDSITRNAVITLATDLGIEVVERTVDRTELYLADEVFLCGTAAEITSITQIDHFAIGSGEMGPVTSQLESLLLSIFRGENADYAHWLTPVY
ncbi:MAG: branched-chain amino acid transaminase [Thermomicrobiales bacterium]|nr:branched-chain amino acid transaminase [Thermomicrobiales bacterium]